MIPKKRSGRWFLPLAAVAFGFLLTMARLGFTDEADRVEPGGRGAVAAEGAGESRFAPMVWHRVTDQARRLSAWLVEWYLRTPSAEQVTWGGLVACGGLGLIVLLERIVRLGERRVVPPAFTARFVDYLHEGRLDCGQALDHCERNPSPAARVALAAVRRWGRTAGDLERAVAMAHRVETEQLRRNVGTLRRVAALSALLGVLGTLYALGRALESIPPTSGNGPATTATPVVWGPALAAAIAPLSTGLIIATLALVAYDGVLSRVEKLAGALDRLGAETIEAIAMSAPPPSAPIALAPSPHFARTRKTEGTPPNGHEDHARTGS
jgi:biopolymer transport protein ExbB